MWLTVLFGAVLLGCSDDGTTGAGVDPETDQVPLDQVIAVAGVPDITHGTEDFTPLALSNTLQDRTFVAFLSGGQEVPSVTTQAFGTMALVVNAAGNKLKFVLRHAVDGATVAHIHNAAAGESGPIAIPLPNARTTSAGVVNITKDQAAELRAGRLYVNVHSSKNPVGEIRGQILRPGETLFTAALSGSEEVPRNDSTASAVASPSQSPGSRCPPGNATCPPWTRMPSARRTSQTYGIDVVESGSGAAKKASSTDAARSDSSRERTGARAPKTRRTRSGKVRSVARFEELTSRTRAGTGCPAVPRRWSSPDRDRR